MVQYLKRLVFYMFIFNLSLIFVDGELRFVEEPTSMVVNASEAHRFSCTVTGMSESDEFAWYKGNMLLAQGNRVIVDKFKVGALTVIPLQTTFGEMSILSINKAIGIDSGAYICAISNPSGIVLRSKPANLIVQSFPSSQYPVCSVSEKIAVVGTIIKLTCKSENVHPPVDLSWTENNNLVRGEMRTVETEHEVINELTLLLKIEHNGMTFNCKQVSDLMPKNQSFCSVGPLNIRYRPNVKIQHTSPVLPSVETAIFCQTFANPPVTNYMWTFYPYIDGSDYKVDNTGQVLTLFRPTLRQNGTNVTCTAINEVGKSSSSIKLLVALSDINQGEHTTRKSINKTSENEGRIRLSLDVVIIIAAGVVIIIVLVVLVPVYHYCLCRNDNITTANLSRKEVNQPEVYYEAREGVILRHTIQDRSLPRVPTTEVYGHWRHSTASQVPNDLESHSYTYIDTEND